MINKINGKVQSGGLTVSIYKSDFPSGASMCIQEIWFVIGGNSTVLSLSTAYGIWWD